MSVDELTALATDDERRRPRRAFVVLLSLGLIGALIALLLVWQGDDRALAELRIRADRAEVRAPGGDFEPGTEGQALAVDDAVRTDANGEAQIDYFDGSLTLLDTDTTVVIGALLNQSTGKRVSLSQESGRTWNRVERLTSSEDRYEVRIPNAVATVSGTTFVLDRRFSPITYLLGFDGVTELSSIKQEQANVGTDDCVRIEEDGSMRACTQHEYEDLLDEKINEWLAYFGLTTVPPGPSASPSASPSPTATFRPSSGGTSMSAATPTPTPVPRRTRRPRGTDDPNETEEPTDEPSPSITTAPPPPMDCDGEPPPDDPECPPPDPEPEL